MPHYLYSLKTADLKFVDGCESVRFTVSFPITVAIALVTIYKIIISRGKIKRNSFFIFLTEYKQKGAEKPTLVHKKNENLSALLGLLLLAPTNLSLRR